MDAHLMSGIELTKKAQAYVAHALAGGAVFVTVNAKDRASIATTIERLINMLDDLDDDPDLEPSADAEPGLGWPENRVCQSEKACGADDDREADDVDGEDGGDAEPSLGWTGTGAASLSGNRDDREAEDEHDEDNGDKEPTIGANETRNGESQERWALSAYGLDEIEVEDEHGGDILDEPHDPEEDDDRHALAGIGDLGADERGAGWVNDYEHRLAFNGNGYRDAQRALRELGRKRPDVPQAYVRIPPGYGS